MLQAPDPAWLEVVNGLLKIVILPVLVAVAVLWFLRKTVLPHVAKSLTSEDAEAMFDEFKKDVLHHSDLERTKGFTQLQKDLTTTIQRETENAMTRALFNMWQSRGPK